MGVDKKPAEPVPGHPIYAKSGLFHSLPLLVFMRGMPSINGCSLIRYYERQNLLPQAE